MLQDDDDSDEFTPAQREEIAREVALRERAHRIARSLDLDPHDVRLILVCLALTPTERLQRGLVGAPRDVAHRR